MFHYDKLPEHMREGAELYLERGINPGSFLTAVLENDLVGAVTRADHINKAALPWWADWLLAEVPRDAWGSPEAVLEWTRRHNEDEGFTASIADAAKRYRNRRIKLENPDA